MGIGHYFRLPSPGPKKTLIAGTDSFVNLNLGYMSHAGRDRRPARNGSKSKFTGQNPKNQRKSSPKYSLQRTRKDLLIANVG